MNKHGRTRWNSIRKLQKVHVGRRPSRSTAVLNENGELTKNSEEVRSRWYRHFSNILNIPIEIFETVVENLQPQSRTLMTHQRMRSLSLHLASSSIARQAARLEFHLRWLCTEKMTYGIGYWNYAEIAPIPKKGNLQSSLVPSPLRRERKGSGQTCIGLVLQRNV